MPLQLWIGQGRHFFFDPDIGVQVGQAYQREDRTWIVELQDSSERIVADLEEAKRVFVASYDPSRVNPGFDPMPGGPASPYDYCKKGDDGRWVVYDEGTDEEHVLDSEVEAVNLAKRLNDHLAFQFVGLEGEEEGENFLGHFEVVDLSANKA